MSEERGLLMVVNVLVAGLVMFAVGEWLSPSPQVVYAASRSKAAADRYVNGLKDITFAPSNDMTDTLNSILSVDQDLLGNVKAMGTVVARQATVVAGAVTRVVYPGRPDDRKT